MSIFDQILGQVSSNVDVKNLAAKVGIDPEQAETAIAALAAGHHAPTDTLSTAAANSGLDKGVLGQIMEHIGGEGALAGFATALSSHPDALQKVAGFLDKDGDGNPLGEIAGFTKGLFGR